MSGQYFMGQDITFTVPFPWTYRTDSSNHVPQATVLSPATETYPVVYDKEGTPLWSAAIPLADLVSPGLAGVSVFAFGPNPKIVSITVAASKLALAPISNGPFVCVMLNDPAGALPENLTPFSDVCNVIAHYDPEECTQVFKPNGGGPGAGRMEHYFGGGPTPVQYQATLDSVGSPVNVYADIRGLGPITLTV